MTDRRTRHAEQVAERRVALDEITADIEIAEHLRARHYENTADLAALRRTAADLAREIRELDELADSLAVYDVERLDNGRYRVTVCHDWTFADGTDTADVADADDYRHTWIEPRSYTGNQSRAPK